MTSESAASRLHEPSLHEQAEQWRGVVRSVIAFVLRESPTHEDVEDCTNETLRRALETHAQGAQANIRGPLKPWLIGIARHVAIDTLRARQRQRVRSLSLTPEPPSSDHRLPVALVHPDDPADERIATEQRAAIVRQALAELPEHTRTALELFHLEGLSYQQVAERMNVPLGTVATWVSRGRKSLAETLRPDLMQVASRGPSSRSQLEETR